jgi:uncharacterized protein (TIGR02246 family)
MDQLNASRHADRIRQLNQAWVAAALERDLDAMMAIYSLDAQELLPGEPALIGRDAIREYYASLLEDLPRCSYSYDTQEVTIAESADLAIVRGSYRFVPDDEEPDDVEVGKFVAVWVYVAGDWRLETTISNSDS